MSLLSKSLKISKTIKNAGRMREIVSVFAKHGFANIAERVKLGRFLIERFSVDTELDKLSMPERIRLAFEELGPTFIKLGQLLATRPDFVPTDWTEEFAKLHDQVQTIDFTEIQKVIEKELGSEWKSKIISIEQTPIGAASIAQVHRAKLKDGSSVVIKVQRPGILQKIKDDLSILYLIAELLETYVPETRPFSPMVAVDEYFKTLDLETNFVVEANNLRRFKQNFENFDEVVIPAVHFDLTTEKVLVMEEIQGIPLSSPQSLKQPDLDPDQLILTGLKAYLKMVFDDGLFHGDLHAGNFFILPEQKIGLIDFGVVGRLNKRAQSSIANMLIALAREDYDKLANEYVDLAPFTDRVQIDLFSRDLRNLIAPFHGLTLKNVNMGRVLLGSAGIAARHGLLVPTELMLFFKSLISVEGMGRRIQKDFDFLSYALEFSGELIKHQYEPSKALDELANIARDSHHLLRDLPRQIHFYLRKANSPNYAFKLHLSDFVDFKKSLESSVNLLFLGLVMSALIIASALMANMPGDLAISHPASIGFSVSLVLGVFALFHYFRK